MVSGPSLSLSANTSLLLRNSSLSPIEPKLDKDDKCDGDDGDDGEEDGDDGDDGEEDGDDESSKPYSARSKEVWKEVLMLVFKLLFVYLMFLFGCTKCLHALNKRTYRDFHSEF